MRSNNQEDPTIREIGGEIFAELCKLPPEIATKHMTGVMVDVVMGVLARHVGQIIQNDEELPVDPLPKGPQDDD